MFNSSTSESITTFCQWLNDSGDAEMRAKLQELAPRLVNTGDVSKESARARIFADYALWCAGKAKHAAKSAEYAKYAKYAAKSAKLKKEIYDQAFETLLKVIEV